MVSFDPSGQLIDQITGHHHGLLEIYAHIYAGMFLFAVSIVSILIMYLYFRSSIFKYQSLFNGIFYSGLIGLGEAFEHVSSNTTLSSIFHYLHLIAAPMALIFYLLGLGEIFEKSKGSKIDQKKSAAILVAVLFVVLILSRFSEFPWDPAIEIPFVLLITIPTIVLVKRVLAKSRVIAESTLMLASLRIILLGVSFLSISILAGRYGEFGRNAPAYVLFHEVQNISHVITGTAIVVLVWTLLQIERLVSSGKDA